jgi:dipeptidyl aminopeptidase/acylaminoacyl peptidase
VTTPVRTSVLPSQTSPRAPTHPAAAALTRNRFRFSPDGMTAACVADDGQGGRYVEAWSFTGPSARWWPLPQADGVTPHTQPIPLNDGRIILWRERAGDSYEITFEITLLDRCERVVGAIRNDELVALRLLAGPGRDPLAIGITVDTRGRSTIWGVVGDPPRLERLVEIPCLLMGGVWLDRAGRLLSVDRAEGGGPAKAVAVDLQDGSWSPLLTVSQTSNDRLLACAPESGLVVVSTDALGGERLGWAKLGADQPVRFPETLHRPHHTTLPLTFDPHGQRVLLQLDEGVRSRLAVYTPATDHRRTIPIPAGCVYQTACWTGDLVRFPFSTPSQPPAIATVHVDDPSTWSVAGRAPTAAKAGWAHAHIERLDGAAGPIEAIVYGGHRWQTSRYVLVALHGGPVDAWRFVFDPLFQRLAAAGIAIVAPNQRGSSGYGAAHTLAIRGAWGGPDLDDVCAIARTLAAQRRAVDAPGLMLLGASYGGFLALLAASCEPDLWSRCVALAPFLSGPRLCEEAPELRGLVERLGGLEALCDDVGPRDVLRLCPALRAKLLIVHGRRDDRIPVTQSRALRARLLELGRREGVDFEYLEVPDGGHELIASAHTQTLGARLVRFLTTHRQEQRRERKEVIRR